MGWPGPHTAATFIPSVSRGRSEGKSGKEEETKAIVSAREKKDLAEGECKGRKWKKEYGGMVCLLLAGESVRRRLAPLPHPFVSL